MSEQNNAALSSFEDKVTREDKIWKDKLRKHMEEEESWEREKENRRAELSERFVKIAEYKNICKQENCVENDKTFSYDNFTNDMIADFESQSGTKTPVISFLIGVLRALSAAGVGVTGSNSIDSENKVLIAHCYFRHVSQVVSALCEDIVDKDIEKFNLDVGAVASHFIFDYINQNFVKDAIETGYQNPVLTNHMSEGLMTMMESEVQKAIPKKENELPSKIKEKKKKCIAVGFCGHCKQDVKCKNLIDLTRSTIVCEDHLQRRTKEELFEIDRLNTLAKCEPTKVCMAYKSKKCEEFCGKETLLDQLFCEKHHKKWHKQYFRLDNQKCPRLITRGHKRGGICGGVIFANGFCFNHQRNDDKVIITCEYEPLHSENCPGLPCGKITKDGDKFCGKHQTGQPAEIPPPIPCQGKKSDGSCCNYKAKSSGFCGHHLKQTPPEKQSLPTNPIILTEEEKEMIEKRKTKEIEIENNSKSKFCTAICKDGDRCKRPAKNGTVCGIHAKSKPVIKKIRCEALTSKGKNCCNQAQEDSLYCGKHANYDLKTPKKQHVEKKQINTTESSSTSDSKRKIVTAPRKLKKIDVVEDSDEEMDEPEECDTKANLTSPKILQLLNDVNEIGALTGWTEQELVRMKNLHIYTRVLNSDKTLNIMETIKETRSKLLQHFKEIDGKCMRVLCGVKTIFEQFGKSKVLDIQNSFENLFGFKGPISFVNREKVVTECRIKMKEANEIARRRERLLKGLPPYEGDYILPDIKYMVAKLREGSRNKSKTKAYDNEWFKLKSNNLNLTRQYGINQNMRDGCNDFITIIQLDTRAKQMKRDNINHLWLVTNFIETILEYRQALFDGKIISKITNFKEKLLTEIKVNRIDCSVVEFFSGMVINDFIDHILDNYQYNSAEDTFSTIDNMNMSPKFEGFLKFDLPKQEDRDSGFVLTV